MPSQRFRRRGSYVQTESVLTHYPNRSSTRLPALLSVDIILGRLQSGPTSNAVLGPSARRQGPICYFLMKAAKLFLIGLQ